MKKNLSDAFVRTIAPPASGRLEISDTVRPGLRLRISSAGNKVWMFEKRIKGGPKRKHHLGSYPGVSIREARSVGMEIALEAERGYDRVAEAEKEEAAREKAEKEAVTVREAIEIHDKLHLKNLRTRQERLRSLKEGFADYMNEPMSSLQRKHLQAIIDAKAASGAPVQANRVKAALSKFAKFSWQRGYLHEHIGASLEKAIVERPRERVLSIDEIAMLWNVSYQLSDTWSLLLRMLILTVQRRSEIAGLVWDELDLEFSMMTLLGARTKNSKGHVTYLAEPILEELKQRKAAWDAAVRETEGGALSNLVFTTTGTAPVSGFSNLKKQINGLE